MNEGYLDRCYASGAVVGFDYAWILGGLCGKNCHTIVDCYANGSVTAGEGSMYIGGLIGQNSQGKILRCYSSGEVTVSSSSYEYGGLCGQSIAGELFDDAGNFWDTRASGMTTSAMGSGTTTEAMMNHATFVAAEWDFVRVWGIEDGQTYPYLHRNPPADLNYDKSVNMADLAIFAAQWLEQ